VTGKNPADDCLVTDPILIAGFLSFGVCLTRALVTAARVKTVCARCGLLAEQAEAERTVCSCETAA
jgi:hypothetical protein